MGLVRRNYGYLVLYLHPELGSPGLGDRHRGAKFRQELVDEAYSRWHDDDRGTAELYWDAWEANVTVSPGGYLVEVFGADSIAPLTVEVPRDVLGQARAMLARLREIGAQVDRASAAEVAQLDEEAAELREALADMFTALLENAGLVERFVIRGCFQAAERMPQVLTCGRTCTIL